MSIWVTCGLRDPLVGILDNISGTNKAIKLETSNMAHIRMAVSTNEKNAKLGQEVSCGVT